MLIVNIMSVDDSALSTVKEPADIKLTQIVL